MHYHTTLAALAVVLLSGCASSSTGSKPKYDRQSLIEITESHRSLEEIKQVIGEPDREDVSGSKSAFTFEHGCILVPGMRSLRFESISDEVDLVLFVRIGSDEIRGVLITDKVEPRSGRKKLAEPID